VTDQELMDGLVQTSFTVVAVLSRVGARHDLSLTQLRLFGILRDRRLGVTDLADRLGLEKSTVSGLVDRAVRRGLVERTAVPGDGRAVHVTLSAAGQRHAAEVAEQIAAELAPLTDRLAGGEQRRLQALLTRLIGAG
jgi:DNA-binding MarR family transcriptional regulator